MATSSATRALARLATLIGLMLCFTFAATSARAQGQGLAAVGPLLANGFPAWFQDRQGLALEQCLTTPATVVPVGVTDPCALAGTVGAGAIAPFTNFPNEFFFMRAVSVMDNIGASGTGRAVLTMALEGAFASGAAAANQQILFARFRLRVLNANLTPGATYTLTYPYGTQTFVADTGGEINANDDQGCFAVPCVDFGGVLNSTNVGPFLQWDPAVLPAAPAGYIGDPAVLHPIIGSTFPDNNKFRLEGPNIGGPGVNAIETNLFVIIGKKFTGVVPPPLTVNRASYVRPSAASAQINVFAQSSGAATLVASGAGIPSTPLTRDAATGRFFAPIVPTTPASLPGFVRITASVAGAPDTIVDHALVDEISVSNATFDENNNTLTVQATSSDLLAPPPILEARDSIGALGVLVAGSLAKTMPVPAAQVTVNSSAGGVGVLPVTLVKRTPVATSTALAVSASPIFRAQAVTLTATVSAASGTAFPTGTVTFKDGTATLGTGTLNGSGVATLIVPANTLAAATHPITAEYGGVATFFLASTSPLVNLVVQLQPTTTALAAVPATIVNTQAVTLTATVSPNPGAGGLVTFRDGGATLGTANVNAANGQATLTVAGGSLTGSAAGITHSLTAAFAATASFAGSTSTTVNLVVTTAAVTPTTTTLTASPAAPTTAQSVLLTATVTPPPGAGASITFRDGATTLGSGTLNASGVATLTVTAGVLSGSPTGTVHPLTALYAGSATFGASTSAVLNVIVTGPAALTPTTTSTITATPAFLGGIRRGSVNTLTVTVSSAAGTPTGSVTFRDNTQNITLGTVTLSATGVGALVVPANTFSAAGFLGTPHSITVTYGGSASHATSTSTTSVRIFN